MLRRNDARRPRAHRAPRWRAPRNTNTPLESRQPLLSADYRPAKSLYLIVVLRRIQLPRPPTTLPGSDSTRSPATLGLELPRICAKTCAVRDAQKRVAEPRQISLTNRGEIPMSVPQTSRPTLVLTALALGVAAELAIFA